MQSGARIRAHSNATESNTNEQSGRDARTQTTARTGSGRNGSGSGPTVGRREAQKRRRYLHGGGGVRWA
eukprot:6054238-Pleurochrysis_carterae.AAC.1